MWSLRIEKHFLITFCGLIVLTSFGSAVEYAAPGSIYSNQVYKAAPPGEFCGISGCDKMFIGYVTIGGVQYGTVSLTLSPSSGFSTDFQFRRTSEGWLIYNADEGTCLKYFNTSPQLRFAECGGLYAQFQYFTILCQGLCSSSNVRKFKMTFNGQCIRDGGDKKAVVLGDCDDNAWFTVYDERQFRSAPSPSPIPLPSASPVRIPSSPPSAPLTRCWKGNRSYLSPDLESVRECCKSDSRCKKFWSDIKNRYMTMGDSAIDRISNRRLRGFAKMAKAKSIDYLIEKGFKSIRGLGAFAIASVLSANSNSNATQMSDVSEVAVADNSMGFTSSDGTMLADDRDPAFIEIQCYFQTGTDTSTTETDALSVLDGMVHQQCSSCPSAEEISLGKFNGSTRVWNWYGGCGGCVDRNSDPLLAWSEPLDGSIDALPVVAAWFGDRFNFDAYKVIQPVVSVDGYDDQIQVGATGDYYISARKSWETSDRLYVACTGSLVAVQADATYLPGAASSTSPAWIVSIVSILLFVLSTFLL